MKSLNGNLNGDEKYLLGNCINFSIPTVDAEAFMLTTKDLISIIQSFYFVLLNMNHRM